MIRVNRSLIFAALVVHLIGYNLWPYTWKDFYYQAQAIQQILIGCLLINLSKPDDEYSIYKPNSTRYDTWLYKGIWVWFGWQIIELFSECNGFELIADVFDMPPTRFRITEFFLALICVCLALIGQKRIRRLID